MARDTSHSGYGRWVYGLGVMAIGLLGVAFATFDPGQPVPKGFPDRLALAYAAGALLVVAGAAIEWRRTTAWAAGALALYFGIVVVVLMNGPVILAHWRAYGSWSGPAAQLAIAAGGLIVFAAHAKLGAGLAARLTRIGQMAFGVCAVLFGGAHFVYMNLTAPLVPEWLPPSQVFWGYATGVFHIAAGLAILANMRARLAAILLTVMYAAFTPLVHIPQVLAHPQSHWIWTENAANLVLTGVAWVVADSLARRTR
jgi:uncharacterized membrane protein